MKYLHKIILIGTTQTILAVMSLPYLFFYSLFIVIPVSILVDCVLGLSYFRVRPAKVAVLSSAAAGGYLLFIHISFLLHGGLH